MRNVCVKNQTSLDFLNEANFPQLSAERGCLGWFFALTTWLSVAGVFGQAPAHSPVLRPPAVPLVACDPYFSIWSPADKATDSDTVHWTGTPHRLSSLVRIDGKAFRLLGKEPAQIPALPQTGVQVLPSRTIYSFEGQGIGLSLTFMTPALPEDLSIYARPVTYVTWTLHSIEPTPREVELYFDASAELTVNTADEEITCAAQDSPELRAIKIGSTGQPILARRGDDLRINWGHLYVAALRNQAVAAGFGSRSQLQRSFTDDGSMPRNGNSPGRPGKAKANAVAAGVVFQPGKVGPSPVSRWLMLAYDDEYSIQYFKHNLRPYWRRNGEDAAALLRKSAADYEALATRCAAFDAELMADLTRSGGETYAMLCALAYRQCCAGCKVAADASGQPLVFPKEIGSSGMMSSISLIYPMAPQFLLLSPSLMKGMLVPILDYAASYRWRWQGVPHDLGRYPVANGAIYGGGELIDQTTMPMEDTANMLILMGALAQAEGRADFAARYWPLLKQWAGYVKTNGLDPAEQFCSDDFTGLLAHNANLSVKGICALGAFANLNELRGDSREAADWRETARTAARQWIKQADDGDHFRLAFDRPGTWSQKYNLVWDRILGLGLYPESVRQKEMAFYRTRQNTFGLPLDNRDTYTKLDWILWTATLTQDRNDFAALLTPLCGFINQTTNRIPLSDWFWTDHPDPRGFRARPVVGASFLQMLYDQSDWQKWVKRDVTRATNWAPILKPPLIVTVLATSENDPALWHYTTQPPPEGWTQRDFNDVSWRVGPGGFGTNAEAGTSARTEWQTDDIWLRREFSLGDEKWSDLRLRLSRSSDTQVYFNGVLASALPGYKAQYELATLKGTARATLKPGRNVLAVHARRTAVGQFFDMGVVDLKPDE